MGLENMKLGSDLFAHSPTSVPAVGLSASRMMQASVSVALKRQAGEIKVTAMLRITELSFSSVHIC